jgi:hypothetical protein
MNTLFKSWLIANFEIFVSTIVGIVCIVAYFAFPKVWGQHDILHIFVFFTLLTLLPSVGLISPPRFGIIEDIIGLVMIIGVYIYSFDVVGSEMYYTLPIPIIAMIEGISASIYAYRNFEDVTSRRMLYHNSSVSLFTMQLKYAFHRFCGVFLGICLGCISIIVIIWICRHGSIAAVVESLE